MASNDYTYTYTVVRAKTGREPLFVREPPSVLFQVAPDPSLRELFVEASMMEHEISNVPVLSCTGTNTDRKELENAGALHKEGGWPLSLDPTEADERMKYCKRQERDERYLASAALLTGRMSASIRLNCALDIYSFPFEEEQQASGLTASTGADEGRVIAPTVPADGKPSATTQRRMSASALQTPQTSSLAAASTGSPASAALQRISYTDEETVGDLYCAAKYSPKGVAEFGASGAVQCSWTCGSESTKIAVAYSRNESDPHSTSAPTILLWDIHNPSAPECSLQSRHCDASAVACSPKDPHIVVGGTVKGIVQYWDTRQAGVAAVFCRVDRGHKGAVSAIRYLMSRNLECFTVGMDGMALFWDVRKMDAPADGESSMSLIDVSKTPGSDAAAAPRFSAVCLDYDPLVGGAQRFLVGTAEGTVLNCNRRGKTPAEKILQMYRAHYGAVASVSRCPFHPKVFASIGDWGYKLFADELRTPFFVLPYGKAYMTCGTWHPIRASVLITGNHQGIVELYDVMYSQSHRAMALPLTADASPLRCIAPHASGQHVACSDDRGCVHLVHLPKVFVDAPKGERQQLVSLLEGELSRARASKQSSRGPARDGMRRPSVEVEAPAGTAERRSFTPTPPSQKINSAQHSPATTALVVQHSEEDELARQLAAIGDAYLQEVAEHPAELVKTPVRPTPSIAQATSPLSPASEGGA